MKFATIAASVLVASSVLATAGVVSADDVKTGTAKVAVTATDGVLSIDKAPGKGETVGDTITPNDLDFVTVKLSDFVDGDKTMTSNLDSGMFAVTNTLGVNWKLKAKVTEFIDAETKNHFNGTLKFNNQDITNAGDTLLYSSDDNNTEDWTNASHTKWMSPKGGASMVVPMDTKVGNYKAEITYTLTSGVSSDASSKSPDATQPAVPVTGDQQ
ncbi:hypothetical protein [Weissella confusa]